MNKQLTRIFDLKMEKSIAVNPLTNPTVILISDEIAKKYFPNQNPIG